jgi:competence protein ComEC
MKKFSLVQFFIWSFLIGVFAVTKGMEGEFGNIVFLNIVVVILTKKYFFSGEMGVKIVVVIIGILFGIFRFASVVSDMGDISQVSGNASVQGCITEEADIRNDRIQYVLAVKAVKEGADFQPSDGKVLLMAPKYPAYEYGDCLEVSGEIADAKSSGEFDYAKYLQRYGISKVIYQGKIKLLEDGGGNWFWQGIYSFKQFFEKRLSEIFVEPYGSFMDGLILGSRRGLPDDLVANFKTTGLSHIMAISGYNITIVMMAIGGIFWFLGKNAKVIVSSVCVVLFVILVGMSASVVRAAIMGIIGLFALGTGRQYYAFWGLMVAVFLMNVWNPRVLVYDVGFQLSALATLGLIYVSPVVKKYLNFCPEFLGIRETVVMSLSAQIAVLPIMIMNFGQVSLVSIFANVFVLPWIPFAMLFGFLAVVVSFLSMPLGNMIGFFGYLTLKIVIFFVEVFAGLPFASVEI